jgi:hypothetical protein
LEGSVAGKLLEALKELVPDLARAALITDPVNPASPINVNSFENAARSLAVAPAVIRPRNAGDIERAIGAFAQEPNGGLATQEAGEAQKESAAVGNCAQSYASPASIRAIAPASLPRPLAARLCFDICNLVNYLTLVLQTGFPRQQRPSGHKVGAGHSQIATQCAWTRHPEGTSRDDRFPESWM